ncbi:MAG: amylo-alpha-1,6-glucosidase [bacterium]|nr:amylo-alpha-1,6-glucosidase [bacterium]
MQTVSEIKKVLRLDIEKLRDPRGFLNAGIPRFNRFFGRDSLISGWQLLDTDPLICRATLEALSKLQSRRFNKKTDEEPGKIIHETYSGPRSKPPHRYFPMPYYGAIDSTPLYLIVFAMYLDRTKDRAFVKKHRFHIAAAAEWVTKRIEKDGFLYYQRGNRKGLFHQGWKDGFGNHLQIRLPVAIVEAQGYAYLALSAAAKLLPRSSFNFLHTARELKARFTQSFWMQKPRYFALALDGKRKQRAAITSNPGHLLFTGILNRDQADAVVRRLFKPDIFTSYGIRTHSAKEPDFDSLSYHLGSVWPHDNWIIAQGLKKLGHKQEYLKIKKALLRAYQKIGFIPEFYGVIDNKIILEMEKMVCHPQAWANGALLNFLSQK